MAGERTSKHAVQLYGSRNTMHSHPFSYCYSYRSQTGLFLPPCPGGSRCQSIYTSGRLPAYPAIYTTHQKKDRSDNYASGYGWYGYRGTDPYRKSHYNYFTEHRIYH